MKTRYRWPSPDRVTNDNIGFLFDFLLGRVAADQHELNSATHIGSRFPNPRIELFRNITSQPSFTAKNRDFHAILFDQMLRRRVFAGHRPPKVNVFCVGAPRCGTTTLSALIGRHPQVYSSPIKETNFFSHMSDRVSPNGVSIDMYEMFYFGWRDEPILTDFSPNYLRNSRAIDGLYDYNSDAKIIVCLRNPVDRTLSNFFYSLKTHKSDNALEFFSTAIDEFVMELPPSEKWFSGRTLLRQGLYHSDLRYLKDRFPKILLVEFSMFNDLKALYRLVCHFLEIRAEDVDLTQLEKSVNSSKKEENEFVRAARQLLAKFYADDISKVEVDFGIQLTPGL